jgi:Domain of unknown function (DUF4173)
MSLSVHPDVTARPAREFSPPAPGFARRVLLDALFLGGVADALLRDGFGLGLAIWLTVFAATLVHLVRARGERLGREQVAWLAAAVLFGAMLAWRDSMTLHAVDFLAMIAALAILGATLMRGSIVRSLLGQRVRDLVEAFGAIIKQVLGGVLSLVFGDSHLGEGIQAWRGGRGGPMIRAAVITIPLLLVFGLLFGAADPLFDRLLSLPALDWGLIGSHVLVAGFFTWVVGGWLRGALIDDRPRRQPSDRLAITLGATEVTVILGALVALFALFVGVQVGWLFGGERLVRSTTGLSYAEYARHGFFELVWVSLLVLPVLLGARAAIPDDDVIAVRRYRQTALALILLLAGVMASALGRMALYVHYYGLSADRLFASVFMGWLALVFVWFLATVVRGRTRDFAAGMIITGFATLGALNVVNPDALVARVDVARATHALALSDSIAGARNRAASPIDYTYLTRTLSGDAGAVVIRALVAPPVAHLGTAARDAEVRERCEAVRALLSHTGVSATSTGPGGDWRAWNLGIWGAARSVRAHQSELRQVTCLDAAGEVPFGDRDGRERLPGEQGFGRPPGVGLSTGGGTQ